MVCVILQIYVFVVIWLGCVSIVYTDSPKINQNYNYNLEKAVSIYGHINNDNLDEYELLDYKGALRYIQESALDEYTKEILSNEELLKDIFSYYKGTLLEYSAINKFKGIHI